MKNRSAILCILLTVIFLCSSCTSPAVPSVSTPTSPDHPPVSSADESPSESDHPPVTHWCAHQHTKKIKDLPAECTVDGYADRLQCADCGEILDYTGRILPATGHSYQNRKCANCAKNQPSLVIEGDFENSTVHWAIYDDGEMSVTGKGAIPDFPDEGSSYFFKYNKYIQSIVVYDGITAIGNNVFRGLRDTLTVSISSSVKTIGNHSFEGWSLKTLNLPMRLEQIGENNFTGNQIFFLELPGTLRQVGKGSFTSAQMVTLRVPASVERYEVYEGQYSNFGNVAFVGSLEQVKELDLYKDLVRSGKCSMVNLHFQFTEKASTLPYCIKRGQKIADLTYIVFSDDTVHISKYNGSEDEVTIPGRIGSYTVTGIEHNCFENSTVKKVTLPESCTEIYMEAFLDSSLETLVVNAKTLKVGESAFDGCKSFATLIFSGTFKEVGAAAFAYTLVTNISLDPEMKIARSSAFAHSAIENVNFSQFEIIADSAFGRTKMPRTLDLSGTKEIGMGAFYQCGVENVNVTNVGIIRLGAFSSNSSLKASGVIGIETVGTVEDGAFDFKF